MIFENRMKSMYFHYNITQREMRELDMRLMFPEGNIFGEEI
jgi:hypothetical protein